MVRRNMIIDKIIIDLLEDAIKDKITQKFKTDKNKLIAKINKDIDIPFINEKTEEKALKYLFKHIEKWLNE
tara:strand:+ start:144 stop:356 length:213 start_codon:yes stop_codon:yes gene_type:complete